MKTLIKLCVIIAGYVAAFAAACGAVWVRLWLTQDDPAAQASAGMYAFGDFLCFMGVLGVASLVPTGLALYFLRAYPKFWAVLSLVVLALAIAGPIVTVGMHLYDSDSLATAILFIGQVLGSPLLALGCLTFVAIAPTWRSRGLLFVAMLIEGGVSAYAFLCLFVLGHWL